VVVEDADWRAIQAMQGFRRNHEDKAAFPYWLRDEQPLARLPSLRAVLNLDDIAPLATDEDEDETPAREVLAGETAGPEVTRPQPTRLTVALSSNPLRLGRTAGREAAPVIIATSDLLKNAAFLGAQGCGKSTAALNLIESLVIRGTPAILIDSKGDLASYAQKERWDIAEEDAGRLASRQALKQRVDIVLYTPGNAAGRGLAMPLVPRGLKEMPVFDREQAASVSASAIAEILAYGKSQRDTQCLGILKNAIEVLGDAEETQRPRIEDLVKLIDDKDPSLLSALGRLDTKLMEKLVQDLEGLRIAKQNLLGAGCEDLSADALFGLGGTGKPGRIRLTIIDTRFLGDLSDVRFWMTHFLVEMNRWAVCNQAGKLQALLSIDDADIYLPSGKQPSAKQPLESLLRRTQAAGLCVMLSSRNPAELDYKCQDNIRSWVVGRVVHEAALKKLQPLFSDAHGDVTMLKAQSTGEFQLLAEHTAVGITTERNLIPLGQIAGDDLVNLAGLW
jgi:hypothetical protein